MSDKDKKPEKPLEDPKVNVTVTPKNPREKEHRDAAEKVGKILKEKIEHAVEQNKPGGQEEQFKAADEKTKQAGQSANPKQIEEIKVGVAGKNKDGNRVNRELTVTPGEGKPKS